MPPDTEGVALQPEATLLVSRGQTLEVHLTHHLRIGGKLSLDHTFKHDKATRDFGYQPRYSADEAFNITMEWLKTQKF